MGKSTSSQSATVSAQIPIFEQKPNRAVILDALIYPGIGFGAVVSKSKTLTDSMIIAATRRLASLSPALKDPDAGFLPNFGDSPAVNSEVAIAMVEQAVEEGQAGIGCQKEGVL